MAWNFSPTTKKPLAMKHPTEALSNEESKDVTGGTSIRFNPPPVQGNTTEPVNEGWTDPSNPQTSDSNTYGFADDGKQPIA